MESFCQRVVRKLSFWKVSLSLTPVAQNTNRRTCTPKRSFEVDLYHVSQIFLGVPDEVVKMMVGTHWQCDITLIGKKKWRAILTCKQIPDFNHIIVHEDGDAGVPINNPFYGGKSKVGNT
jgi:hypothetical protein